MRIIGGEFKGRRFNPPISKLPVRPTTDMAKEALFNVLQHRLEFEELKVLDLFGGTGNISLEFASRGVPSVTWVETNRICFRFFSDLIQELKLEEVISPVKSEVTRFLKRDSLKYDLIFADPPWDWKGMKTFPATVHNSGKLNNDGLFILEHRSDISFKEYPGFQFDKKYGSTVFSFIT